VRGKHRKDRIHYGFGIRERVVVPKPQYAVSVGLKPRIVPGIAGRNCVLATVDFHDQLRIAAAEVGGVRTDRFLPNEFEPGQAPIPKRAPDTAFCFSGFVAHST
jgi:hypothetical protein